jgi:hypothetical protein
VDLFKFELTTGLSGTQKSRSMSQNSRHQTEQAEKRKETNKKEKKSVFQLSSVRNRWRGSRRQLGWEVALFLTPLRFKMPRGDRQGIYAENREQRSATGSVRVLLSPR